ncbi:hypothetical protein K458DRAFT_412769 [Lentithecium fluviatile CBS 122367]|uniref:Uncharacterized protein n=1 Tax=Lentithecium fluviatile CBS 122367 TaxID=1168545 RepID=A0A6G1JIE4_9PLEO|nr:hypothetical protein K458DRAFT_412769 [Lentithecium fluviatile CBS 122367]
MNPAMHYRSRSEAGDVSSPRSSRAASFSSDRPSLAGSVSFQMPTSVRPPPAFIAASVASQIVTDHHNAQLRESADAADAADADDHNAGIFLVNALFSEQALRLLNAFLDHLLFAFLSTARSPALTAIRPSITEVLKPRLAREAMATADEELEGLLAGDDDEEFPVQPGQDAQTWDVERVWKRTRLRIMVYTRLGELEDEDEERYVQQERGLSMDDSDDEDAGLVSWASAIFLTSVIEYIAEQTLLVSGQAAYARAAAKMKKLSQQDEVDEDQALERIVVEDFDVEKLALNSALGRLWRTWRKRVRSPIAPLFPRVRSMSSITSLHRRHLSYDTESVHGDSLAEVPEHMPTETEIAANIPLPMSDNDVDEIEVPGLARTFEEAESSAMQTPVMRPQRPNSVIMLAPAEEFRRRLTKERPLSMPPPAAAPFVVPEQHEEADDMPYETPMEQEMPLETPMDMPFETPMERMSDDESYIHDERQEGISPEELKQTKKAEEESEAEHEHDADMVAFAASTGMGFGMSPIVPTKQSGLDKDEDDVDTPTQTMYEGRPQVLQSKRMSIEKPGTPGIVRTYSTRSSSLKSHDKTPAGTPRGQTPSATPPTEFNSYPDDPHTDDDLSGPEAIGVARTSDIPIPTPSPPGEIANGERTPNDNPNTHARHPSHGGYVEVLPRHSGSTSISVRNTPTPEGRHTPVESSVPRKEVQPRSDSLRKEIPRKDVTPAPRPRDITPPRTRGTTLASLQETETWTTKSQSPVVPERSIRRGSPTQGSPKNSSPKNNSSLRSRESPVSVPDRTAKNKVAESVTRGRSGTGDGEYTVEKATLQRVSSSASTTRSASTSILNSARDSDGSLGGRPRNISGRMSEEDRQREFDSLVKSEDTVKYTLTPQNMRDMEAGLSSQDVSPILSRKESPVMKRVEPVKSSPQKAASTHKPAASVTVYPPVKADMDNQFGSQHLPTRTASRSKGPIPSSGSHSNVAKPKAREPRIQNESMRDFADFIRSTGPAPGEERPVQPFVALRDPGPKPSNGSNSSLGLGRKTSTRQGPSHSHTSSLAGEGPSAKPRIHMEPRSPAGQRSGNDDLIDFIRQGPPNTNNQPRIPRAVAPFRTTVDSDQFDSMLDENGNVESTYGSQVSTVSKHSAQTVNSRTGLIPKQTVVQPAYSNTPQNLTGNFSSGEPTIQRTRRRVKDPYAIDSDDEDDDLLTALPKSSKPQQREESMMDFLNSMEPSSDSAPQPFLLSPETVAAAKARAAKNSTTQSPPGMSPSGAAPRAGLGSRFGKGPSAQPAVISSTITSNAPRAHKPRLQAREAATGESRHRSTTNDLADFLRNSGPPEPAAPPPGATIRKEEGKRGSAKFWRKKTYPDMP